MDDQFLSNLFSLEGRVIVLTGGAGYLGQQYAAALLMAGAQVVLFDKERNMSMPNTFHHEQVDITDEDMVREVVDKVFRTYGRIDSLVNNAAMNPAVGDTASAKLSGPYEHHPIDLWRKEIEVNLTGMQICIQAIAPHMMESKRGTIVNIASEVSTIAYDWTDVYPPGKFKSAAYIATKHGVLGVTRAWAAYLGPFGVRVNSFSPGGMQTRKMPEDFVEKYARKNMLGSMAREGEYNAHIIFLCSDASSRMTGHNLVADGGKSAW
ncbi:MAG: SDR family oxidoreductase [Minisyncoccota bacterium]